MISHFASIVLFDRMFGCSLGNGGGLTTSKAVLLEAKEFWPPQKPCSTLVFLNASSVHSLSSFLWKGCRWRSDGVLRLDTRVILILHTICIKCVAVSPQNSALLIGLRKMVTTVNLFKTFHSLSQMWENPTPHERPIEEEQSCKTDVVFIISLTTLYW